jgi:glycerol-3-phosphate dehydrogenase (NAD(P)+)
MADRLTVAEGASTAPGLQQAARAAGVDMPVVDAVCALLSGEASVDDIVRQLLARPLRLE